MYEDPQDAEPSELPGEPGGPRTTPWVPRAGWVEHARLERAAVPQVPTSWRRCQRQALAGRLRVRPARVSGSPRAALTTIDLQDLADCSLLGSNTPPSDDSAASQVPFLPLGASWPLAVQTRDSGVLGSFLKGLISYKEHGHIWIVMGDLVPESEPTESELLLPPSMLRQRILRAVLTNSVWTEGLIWRAPLPAWSPVLLPMYSLKLRKAIWRLLTEGPGG